MKKWRETYNSAHYADMGESALLINKSLYFCSVSIERTMNIYPYSATLKHGVDCSIPHPIKASF